MPPALSLRAAAACGGLGARSRPGVFMPGRRGPPARPSARAAPASPPPTLRLWDAETADLTPEAAEAAEAAGVYYVYAKDGGLQFIGLSRRVAGTLKAHAAQFGPGAVWSAAVVAAPDGATQDALQELWKAEMLAHIQRGNQPPPGNGRGAGSWGRALKVPKRAALQLRRQAGELGLPADAPTASLIEATVKRKPVVAFIKGTRAEPECGFSAQVVNLLDACRADFDVVNVLDDVGNPADTLDTLKEFSTWPTIPQVFAAGEFLGGSDILTDMHGSGLLVRVVANADKAAEAGEGK